MTNEQVARLHQQYGMYIIDRIPASFVRGEGCRVWDADDREFLDLIAGLGVLGLGYGHPKILRAINEQAQAIMHSTNLYLIEPQARLCQKLCEISFADKAFICNSGAEANEAAFKLARKWGKRSGQDRYKIVSSQGSFHGRTLMTVAATAQEKYQAPFRPLPPGFGYVPFNDAAALEKAVDDSTCAVILEPIQGESGVNVMTDEYLQEARRLCTERGALLIFDEIQCGLGRTGRLFCYEHSGAVPDILTLAKTLGGGFPIGATLATDGASVFQPGDHGTTFGGNHTACAAALAFLGALEEENLVENARERGEQMMAGLRDLQGKHDQITDVRGKGLMLAFEVNDGSAKALRQRLFDLGVLVNPIGDSIVRMLPPLIITAEECDSALAAIRQALAA
ncbi:MAG: aspartate aminotransferase family protein [Armatimonadota bacterium]